MWARPKQLDPAAGARKRRSSWRAILHYRINKKTRCPAICGVPGRDVTRSRASANVRLESIAVPGEHLTAVEGNESTEGNHVYIVLDKVNATVAEQAIRTAGMERSDFIVVAGVVARSATSEVASIVHGNCTSSTDCWPVNTFVIRAELVVGLAGDAVGGIGFGPPPVATCCAHSVRWPHARSTISAGYSDVGGAVVVFLGIGADITRVAPRVLTERDCVAGSIGDFPDTGLSLLEQTVGARRLVAVRGRRAVYWIWASCRGAIVGSAGIDIGVAGRAVVVVSIATTVENCGRICWCCSFDAVLGTFRLTCRRGAKVHGNHSRGTGEIHARGFVVVHTEVQCIERRIALRVGQDAGHGVPTAVNKLGAGRTQVEVG